MRRLIFAGAMVIIASTAAIAANPNGVWLSADGRVKVRVTDCNGALCGTVVWLKEPIDPQTHRPRTDKLNPKVNNRDRPMLGLQVVHGLKPVGENKWSGPIYNADEGHSYNVNLTLISPTKVALKGCLLGVFCKVQTWTRAN
jgi:uncharacterized protein (DUF2147 family)